MLPCSISIEQAKEGMITADDVLSPSGMLVIPNNTMLNPRLISRMKLYNVKKLYVVIPESVAAELNKTAPVEVINPMKTTQEFKVFRRNYEGIAGELEEVFYHVVSKPDADHDLSKIIGMVKELAAKVQNTMHLMETLQCLREYSDTVYIHSISVALIANMIVAKQGWTEEDKELLMIASLFHDIGKIHVPSEILNKPTRLTDDEYEIVKKHPQLSYEILRRAHFPSDVLWAALLHHERCDGSGYPSGVAMEMIPKFARVIAIADVYDAMTARRIYRSEICSFDVIAEFENSGYQKYDATLLIPFLESIAQSHINAKVRLSNTLIGTIVMINQHKLSRPVVNIDGTFFDLAKEKDVSIVEII